MTTANEYRQYARECTDSARNTTEPLRSQFLELAKLWLTAAARTDAQEASPAKTNSKGNGHAPADPGGVEAMSKAEEYPPFKLLQ